MREDNRYGYKRYILTKQELIDSFNNPYKVVWQASGHGRNAIWTYENLMHYLEYHQHYSWGICDRDTVAVVDIQTIDQFNKVMEIMEINFTLKTK